MTGLRLSVGRSLWDIIVLLCLAQICVNGEKEIYKRKHETLHTKNGIYDSSWHPVEFQSEKELLDAISSKSYLVAYLNDNCRDSFHPIYLRNAQRDLQARYMGIATMTIANSEPCKLTQFGVEGDVIFTENEITDWEKSRHTIKHLVQGHKRVPKFLVENASDKEVSVYWVNAEEGNKDNFVESLLEYPVLTLKPGASDFVGTFLGHIFVAFDTETEQIFDFADVSDKKTSKFVIGERKLINDSLKEDFLDPHVLDQQQKDGVEVEQILREYVYNSNMEVRMALSDTQVHFVPQVTDVGFEKAKLPKEMFQQISDFYFSNYNTSKTVIEKDGGPLYNQRVIPTYHTPLPYGLKMNIFDELKQMMEEWSGLAPLVGTSIYGVRTYTRGSYLHMHVDTADTHVVSGIVHIHHENLEEPWPLEILDHEGRLTYINMDAGDFVFYESAKLLHGRPHPLKGDSYANMFVHYKPVSGWSVEF